MNPQDELLLAPCNCAPECNSTRWVTRRTLREEARRNETPAR
jgi:hypothetical protein